MARRKPSLSHLDKTGAAHMVDVGAKRITRRTAVATAVISMKPDVLDRILTGRIPKGDVLAVARTAGILAAKRTDELIPLCHPLNIDQIQVDFERTDRGELRIRVEVRLQARTGAEMEALTAASVTALTVYDMCKSADRSMVIGPIRLESKTGGKSGSFRAGR